MLEPLVVDTSGTEERKEEGGPGPSAWVLSSRWSGPWSLTKEFTFSSLYFFFKHLLRNIYLCGCGEHMRQPQDYL